MLCQSHYAAAVHRSGRSTLVDEPALPTLRMGASKRFIHPAACQSPTQSGIPYGQHQPPIDGHVKGLVSFNGRISGIQCGTFKGYQVHSREQASPSAGCHESSRWCKQPAIKPRRYRAQLRCKVCSIARQLANRLHLAQPLFQSASVCAGHCCHYHGAHTATSVSQCLLILALQRRLAMPLRSTDACALQRMARDYIRSVSRSWRPPCNQKPRALPLPATLPLAASRALHGSVTCTSGTWQAAAGSALVHLAGVAARLPGAKGTHAAGHGARVHAAGLDQALALQLHGLGDVLLQGRKLPGVSRLLIECILQELCVVTA
jgi:hypothetical protein